MKESRIIEQQNGHKIATVSVTLGRGYWSIAGDSQTWSLDGRMALAEVWDWLLYDFGRNYYIPLRYRS